MVMRVAVESSRREEKEGAVGVEEEEEEARRGETRRESDLEGGTQQKMEESSEGDQQQPRSRHQAVGDERVERVEVGRVWICLGRTTQGDQPTRHRLTSNGGEGEGEEGARSMSRVEVVDDDEDVEREVVGRS
jgi:hypothetical protein